jgi:hypothetical protein
MRWNGVNSQERFLNMVASGFGSEKKSRYEASPIELLAKVAHLDVSKFARLHTTLPLRRGIVYLKSNVPHGSQTERSLLWSTGIRVSRDGSYYCKDCVNEDQWFHGYSYWRREHQIPGLLWCQKHLTPLNFVEDTTAFISSPTEHATQSQSHPVELVKTALANSFIKRYLEICSGIMERDTPINGKQVSLALRAKAVELGFRTGNARKSMPLLSDAVISAFGRPWLDGVLPSLSCKPEGDLLRQFDNVLSLDKRACKVCAYILASAVMFESSDGALNALTNKFVVKPTKRETHDSKMVEAYISQHGNYAMTTATLFMNKDHAMRRLRAMNLPNILEPVAPNTVRAVVAFFHEGLSFSESALKAGVNQESLEYIIRKPNAIQIGSEITYPPASGSTLRGGNAAASHSSNG